MSDAWTNDFPIGEMGRCVLCNSKTKSHAVYVVDEGTRYEPGGPDEHDLCFPVCHSCYREYDADAAAVADALTDERQPLLDASGLTPSVMHDYLSTDEMDPERVKAIGEAPVEEMVAELEPGDVVEINDEYTWVLVPTSEDTKAKLQGNLLYTILLADDQQTGAGGIVRSEHPLRDDLYVAQKVGDAEQPDYKQIETMELLGHKQLDMDALDIDAVRGAGAGER